MTSWIVTYKQFRDQVASGRLMLDTDTRNPTPRRSVKRFIRLRRDLWARVK